MSALKSRKGQDLQKPFPRCMGRMINVFELSAGMGGTKLNDKAHRDGSPSRRNHPDVVKKYVDPGVVYAKDKHITSELRKSSSTKKSGGAPIKMLIAREMSKEESKKKQPNVVARLMGLDEAAPAHQSVRNSAGRIEKSGRSSRVTLAGALQNSRQLEDGYFDRLPYKVHSCACEREYRDVYEIWQQPPRNSHFKDQPLQKGRYIQIQNERRMALGHKFMEVKRLAADEKLLHSKEFQDTIEIQNERRMALVRQKFMEAKRLATDEKLLQSKEFQDALEVLSSNRDLFLKFLEEPNSLFSNHLKELHSTPAAPQTKRITILKPSRTVEMKGDTQVKKQRYPLTNGGWDLEKPQRSSSTTQPTRIVVLKPSPGKLHDTKAMVIPCISSLELIEKGDFDQVLEAAKSMGSREAAQGITHQMRESVSSNRRDESLLSSIFSNGYVGDESSFNRSENEHGGEEDGNFSDSEIRSPTSRRSWDYSNRFGSPYSLSSFSRASNSPEPSVIREAKKRLSERWSLLTSNGNSQEQLERRSSSTLGEVLSIPEIKKEEVRVGGLTVSSSRSYGGEEDMGVASASSSACQPMDGDSVEKSSSNLSRSKSLPVSYAFKNIGLNSEVSNSGVNKAIVAKDTSKSKTGKSSFKGKVSSLFFSRTKKGGREKSISSLVLGSDNVGRGGSAEPVEKEHNDLLPGGCPPVNSEEESVTASTPATVKGTSEHGTLSLRAVLSLEKPSVSESLSDNKNNPSSLNKISENLNQPSPTTVLEEPFDDDNTINSTPNSSEISNHGCSVAPIESVARTLSWDETNLEISSPDTSNLATALHKANAEEQQLRLFVQNILSTAGLDKNSLFTRRHSVDCPLDPILLDKFLDQKEEDAKSRERRSNQRLLFDCINSALLEIGRITYLGSYPWGRVCSRTQKKAPAGSSIGDEVWVLISDWFSGEERLESGETDNSSLVVDMLLRKEVGGSGWAESMQSEIDEISKEIGGKVLDELIGETLLDLTIGCVL